jgi:hypothetical protein
MEHDGPDKVACLKHGFPLQEMSKGRALSEAPQTPDKAGAVEAVRLLFSKRCIRQGEAALA